MSEARPAQRGFFKALETWLYDLNARDHWLFRLMEWVNDQYARGVFRGVRRRAAAIDDEIRGRDRPARMRALRPQDLDLFADLLSRFDFAHLPPHPLDRKAAALVLRRPSYLPFVILRDDEPVGYCLVRLIFPNRCFSGVWTFPSPENAGLSRAGIKLSGEFTDGEGITAYVTVPLDNAPSRKGAEWAGWFVVGENQRFWLMRRPVPRRRFPFAPGYASRKCRPPTS
jgi:hypothetical protein